MYAVFKAVANDLLFPVSHAGVEKMDTSELGSLQLSALELKSVVDGKSSESTPYLEFLLKYPLVGGGKVTDPDTCGKFSNWSGCLDVATNLTVGYDGVFTRKIHYSCGRISCPECYRGWASKEARKVEARLTAASDRYGLPIEHLVVTIDPKFYPIGDEKAFRKMELKALKALGVHGFKVWHGSRHRRYERINGDPAQEHNGFRQFGTDWSCHSHELGIVEGGFTCRECHHKCEETCNGFNQRRWKYAQKHGVYVKVVVKGEHKYAERRSIFRTAAYELNHASIDRDAKRAHVGVWHGKVGYRNMQRVKVPKEANLCPVCLKVDEKKPIVELIYAGKKNFVLNRLDPNYQKETMQDLYEDGLQVWYVKPKRVWGVPVKSGFTIQFEGGGKHGAA